MRPGALAGGIADQVLPDFNYGIGKAALRAVLPQAIALELPRIGLIVADDEIALGIETVEQRFGQARIAIPQDANVPRSWNGLPALREGVDGKQRRCDARSQALIGHASDRLMVGAIKKIDAARPLALIDAAIAGYHRTIR